MVKANRWYVVLAIQLPAAVLTACNAVAADRTAAPESRSDSTWVVTLGASVEYGPKFPGSRHDGFSAMPSFDIRRFDEPDENSAPDDNIDYGLFDIMGVEIGPVIGFRDSRSASDDHRLNGIHEVNWSIDAGLFAQYWAIPNKLRFRSEVRQGVSNGSGLVVDIGADLFQPLGEKWMLSAGPRVSFGNGAYMQKYFGISATEAARNGSLSSFNASSGLKSVGFEISASYDLAPGWTAQIYDRLDRLTGDAADSPITSKLGSRNQNVIGMSLSKSFAVDF